MLQPSWDRTLFPRIELSYLRYIFILWDKTFLSVDNMFGPFAGRYSTVTDFARLRGLSTSVPRARAAW